MSRTRKTTPWWHRWPNLETALRETPGSNQFCGCRTCTDHYGRRADRRRARQRAKREIAEQLQDA